MSTLRLVPQPGQESPDPLAPRKKYRHRIPPLTSTESGRVRAAVQTLYRKLGSWSCLAAVLDVSQWALKGIAGGKSPGSAAVALRIARLAGVHVEALLSGLVDATRCATCGRRTPALTAGCAS